MSGTPELIARLWARFQPLAVQRVGAVGEYVRAGTEGSDAMYEAARQAAHDLVGSLGSYGHPEGSVLAARLEELLGDRPGAMSAAARSEAQTLVASLEQEVGR
ncbi:Hpt domain-containing protein [Cellulomonas aerilata]|uniref:Hpt domain-containing protein n=1 Tax=Cellulomonas aerilata TaxID=515326 RepID=UPI0016499A99|nr:Hpt domain-containing protein [Cellulomonas aerilata]